MFQILFLLSFLGKAQSMLLSPFHQTQRSFSSELLKLQLAFRVLVCSFLSPFFSGELLFSRHFLGPWPRGWTQSDPWNFRYGNGSRHPSLVSSNFLHNDLQWWCGRSIPGFIGRGWGLRVGLGWGWWWLRVGLGWGWWLGWIFAEI